MKVKYEAMAKAGSYEKDGVTKTRWHKVGVVLQGDKGFSLKIESLPINFDGWVSFFEPRENTTAAPATKKPSSFADLEDDIPF